MSHLISSQHFISDSEAAVKVKKTGVVEGARRCGEAVLGLLARDRQTKYRYFIGEERSKAVNK